MWLVNLILIVIAGGIGFFLGKKSISTMGLMKKKKPKELEEMHRKAQVSITERTKSRKARILKYIKKEMEYQKQLQNCNLGVEVVGVTCNEIEELLDISDSTARKYLNELEEEGKIEQIGKTGRGVTYKIK